MRVQRAPNAADQPARPPTQRPATGVVAPGFTAHVDLDVTDLMGAGDQSGVVAEIIALLVAGCREERLVDDRSVLRYVKLTEQGLVGVELDGAVKQSAYAISSALKSLSPKPFPANDRTLTVVNLEDAVVNVVGDWGWSGLGVATVGAVVPSLVSAGTDGLRITERLIVRLGFSVPSSAAAHAVVRVLNGLARSV